MRFMRLVADVVAEERAELARQRDAKIAAARNNIEVLMAAGVIVSEGTAYDNAMRTEGMRELAAYRGISVEAATEQFEQERAARHLIWLWKTTLAEGETELERAHREAAHLATIPCGPDRAVCKHKRRNGASVWHPIFADIGQTDWVCERCGARTTTVVRAKDPELGMGLGGFIAARLLMEYADEIQAFEERTRAEYEDRYGRDERRAM